jgi:hypothetical protein
MYMVEKFQSRAGISCSLRMSLCSRKLAFDSTFWVSPIYHEETEPIKEYVESVEQKNDVSI